MSTKLYTIGFTKTNAEHFFERLKAAGVQRLIDVRLNNVSQLAGFAKRDDLRYFLNQLCSAEYSHRTELAPTKQLLDDYKKRDMAWREYEQEFLELITKRGIEADIDEALLDGACLLCSEASAEHCHRRLVAEYLQNHIPDLEVVHL